MPRLPAWPDTGHIWTATRTGGFWVLELEPQIRAALGLPATEPASPDGAPPRPPASRALTGRSPLDTLVSPFYYCTLAPF